MKMPVKRSWIIGGALAFLIAADGCTRTEQKYVPAATMDTKTVPTEVTPPQERVKVASSGTRPPAKRSPRTAVKTSGVKTRDTGKSSKSIQWTTSLQAALREAGRTGKPIMIDWFTHWCPPCKMLDKETFAHPKVIKESRKWLTVKVDVDANRQLSMQYGITGFPTVMFLNSRGEIIGQFDGFHAPEDALEIMQEAYNKVGISL